MSDLKFIKCCNECWHNKDNPCFHFIDCILGKPVCHNDVDCELVQSKKISQLRNENSEIIMIFVGSGTCGLGAGAGKTITAIRKYIDEKSVNASIVEVGCIGICTEEPLIDIQMPGKSRVSFKKITEDKVNQLLDNMLNGVIPNEYVLGQYNSNLSLEGLPLLSEHPFFKNQTRWVLENIGRINPVNINEYIANNGFMALSKTLRDYTPIEICNQILESGLRGRGGGGFLTGKKWLMAESSSADQKYLICNADEGDPGAFMDRALIEGDPYKLIEGIAIASYAIGASKAYVYLRAEYPLAIKNLKIAISKAIEYGLLGSNILDSGFNLDIVIKMGAGAFVCGEETALINSIEGKRGMPKPRPPFPAMKGLFGKPTIINNVETLANIPKIILNGAKWFNAIGTETSKGTKVFALSGNINITGLVEVSMGTSIDDIVYTIGGGIPNNKVLKAVQIGGPSGGCIHTSILDIEVDYESLKTVGAMMGSGGLVVMDEDTCMVDIAKFFMDFIQRESCGKCIPCREGTRRMLEILEKISSKQSNGKSISQLERFQSILHLKSLAEVIQDTSLCGLGKSAPNPVLSTLRWFSDEYDIHVYEKRCPAKKCKDLLVYQIDNTKCNGCTLCSKNCPSDAILGELKHHHYINQDKCIGCGACLDVCKPKAIFVN
jgi:NADH:ubiquinone oxidoreductase subunit F (NADH-binding)/NAD-dependent dihydropyrimidine dehydrogenase PreA subunit